MKFKNKNQKLSFANYDLELLRKLVCSKLSVRHHFKLKCTDVFRNTERVKFGKAFVVASRLEQQQWSTTNRDNKQNGCRWAEHKREWTARWLVVASSSILHLRPTGTVGCCE